MKRLYRHDSIHYLLFFALPAIIILLYGTSRYKKPDIPLSNVAAFRIQPKTLIELKELSEKYRLDFVEVLTYYSLENNFFDSKDFSDKKTEHAFIINYTTVKNKYRKKSVNPYYELLNSIYSEIKYFPVPIYDEDEAVYIYGDSWGAEREYGGNRLHLGTDIIDRENIAGRIPVISMTDGVIEQIGWNEKGGWRVGVRSGNGNYYYYAHLENYASSLNKGMNVKAGQLLGFMGNTGYSKKEGTKGNFVVHLHVGISPKTDLTKKEFWINPYPFLRMIEESGEGAD